MGMKDQFQEKSEQLKQRAKKQGAQGQPGLSEEEQRRRAQREREQQGQGQGQRGRQSETERLQQEEEDRFNQDYDA